MTASGVNRLSYSAQSLRSTDVLYCTARSWSSKRSEISCNDSVIAPPPSRAGIVPGLPSPAVGTGLMPAAVYEGGGRLAVRDLPVPPVGPDEVLVEVSHCGICGTDLHLVLEERARPGSVLGHEWAGTVADVGAAVEGWSVGDAVVATPDPGCGECRACLRGRPSVCLRREPPDYLSFRGAFARYVTVAARRLAPLPAGVSTRTAALTEPTAVALHAVTLGAPVAGERVLVSGAGPVGLLVTAVLRAKGVDDITVVEPSAGRRARALAVGAAAAIEPADLPAPPMGLPVEHPYTVVFECSGNGRAAAAALDQLDFE